MSEPEKKPDWDTVRDTVNRYWPDLGFEVVGEAYDHRLDFKLYRRYDDGKNPADLSYEGAMGPVGSLAEADCDIRGTIKWDGCANTIVGDDCMWHTCDRQDFLNLGEALARIWDLGAETIPHSMCEPGTNKYAEKPA